MDSLANYASDGDNSNNSDDVKMPNRGQEEANRRASDANYDPVQMDMSEESNNNNLSRESSSERANSPSVAQSTFGSRTESSRALSSPSDQRRADHENHTSSKDDYRRGDRSDRSRHTSDKSRRYDDRRQRDSNSSRDRKSRDDDKRKTSSSKDEKSDDRERSDKDHHYRGDDRRDRNRDRNERDRRRDRSDRERDRRHSRDDRSKDRHRDERSNYHKEKDRTRSRSRSRDRAPPPPFRMMSYREEKGRNKLAQLEKLGIELKPLEGGGDLMTSGGMQSEQNYYNPLATATQGKYAEQIQKRKLLWANKSKQDDGKSASTTGATANTWMGTTFTHDQDGKVSAKFKRLMGIKGDLPSAPTVGAKPDILKKQEEMFNNMEQQYEVARATTHTQRGVGLGYATGGYQFPR
ncbi:Arginine/serine-rich coiled-coil protein 2 [Camponotus japonicus]